MSTDETRDPNTGDLFAPVAVSTTRVAAAERSGLSATLTKLPGATRLRGAMPVWQVDVASEAVRALCLDVAARSGRLAALWGADVRDQGGAAGFRVHLALAFVDGMLWVSCSLPASNPSFADLSDIFAPAGRMQRALTDLLGIRTNAADTRPWLRHGAWPADVFPLRRDVPIERSWPNSPDPYRFVQVDGDGVHEIPVGPVHAGTIEPGHFRFSIVGEKVVRLEERLGYKHKAIDKRFEALDLESGARLAARVSGDSTVAFGWSYAMAVEAIADVEVPIRALALRALALERERIANHLGDLGYLGNDGGLAFGLAQFMRLKEDVLRTNTSAFGHRYAMDFVIPGGTARDLWPDSVSAQLAQCDALQAEVALLRDIYDDHAGLQDRFQRCGHVAPALAAKLGLIGLAGRASGQAWDTRVAPCYAPYQQYAPTLVTLEAGDVAARVNLRFEEIFESLRLTRAILENLPPGNVRSPIVAPRGVACGLGWVEGWRGEVVVALEARDGHIVRGHAHDPSWQNWPALEHAILGNIVPDFPLINKSFNLSYSGPDL